jgi:predicted ATP-grasp superfamily ATP-dependent carboligase
MTRVFVYEDVTATWAGGDSKSRPAPSLLAEGRAMLGAITEDFRRVPGVEVLTWRQNSDSAAAESEFCRHARAAEYTLVIAPECGGRLEQLCRGVVRVGGRLLGPSPDAVRLTADKLELARHWKAHGVATPATWPLGEEPAGLPVVVKPKDGAGSLATVLSTGRAHGVAECPGAMIAQEYVSGFAASIAFLVRPNSRTPLVPCQQLLSDDGRFQYLGGRLLIASDLAKRTVGIATAAIDCVPGLLGYVGVDVVLGQDGRDWAIEINPRLTTSYVGLRALARFNLAEAMLAVVRGEPIPPFKWNAGPIAFTPDGRVSAGA